MLRQDYSQIDLSTSVRTSSLGRELVLPAVGKLLAMGNWISHGWRSTEGWWEKQSLLVTSTASEMSTHEFCFNLKFFFWPTSSALISVAWPEAGDVLGKPRIGEQLCNGVKHVWTVCKHGLLWWKIHHSLFLPSFLFVFTAYFTYTCLWSLSSYLMGQF